MKNIYFIFTLIAISCGASDNDLATRLINEKKSTEDSLRIVSALEMNFQSKARANQPDSAGMQNIIDSITFYHRKAAAFKMELDKIEFSLDSISVQK